MNFVYLIGRTGQEPELRMVNGPSKCVVNIGLATTEVWKKDGVRQEKTEWHNLVLWGRTAEVCKQYVRKGQQIAIVGRLQTRDWKNKTGALVKRTEIVVDRLELLGSRPASQDAGDGPDEPVGSEISDEDIPF